MPLKNEPDWEVKEHTFGEMLGPCATAETEEEAQEYLGKYIAWTMRFWGSTFEDAQETCKVNIGYFAGYYDNETMHRIHTLFHVHHPFLG